MDIYEQEKEQIDCDSSGCHLCTGPVQALG